MSENERVNVTITGTVAGLVVAMGEGAAAVKEGTAGMTESIEGMTGAVESAMAPLVALFALFEAFEGIKSAVEQVSELAVDMEILAMKTGMSVEALTALEGAAKLSHVSAEALNTGIQRLSKNMEGAAKEAGPAYDAMTRLGLSATQANGALVPTQTLLLQLAEKFAGMEDGIGKTALAMDLFGRSGAAMIPLLNKGSEGIKALGEEVAALGGTMTTEEQESILRYHEAMEKVDVAIEGVKRKLVEGLMPALTAIAASFTSSTGAVTEAGRAWREAGEDLGSLLKVVLAAKMIGDMNILGSLMKGTATADIRATIADIKALFKEVSPLLNDPALFALVGGKKTPPPSPTGKKDTKEATDDWKEEYEGVLAFMRAKEKLDEDDKKKVIADRVEELEYILTFYDVTSKEAQNAYTRVYEAQNALAKETAKSYEDAFKEIPKAFESALQQTVKVGGDFKVFMTDIFREVTLASISAGVTMLAHHIAVEKAKEGATWSGAISRVAAEAWAGLESIASSLRAALAQMAHAAYVAAAWTWASVSAIPVIGPFLAPVMAVAALASILALAGSIRSAHDGYDVPAGSNPLTQLHAQEMVLPADLANKIRGMTDGGGGDIHIHAMDAKSFADFADRNYAALGAAVRKAAKYGGAG